MKEIYIIAKISVDEGNPMAPSDEDCQTAVKEALTTPDNDHYGVKDITVWVGTRQFASDLMS